MLKLSQEQIASREAMNIINQVNSVLENFNKAVTEGTPVRGNMPAITPDQYKEAFGSDALAKLSAAYSALNN